MMKTMILLTLAEVAYERLLRGRAVVSLPVETIRDALIERLPIRSGPLLIPQIRRALAELFPIYKNRRARVKSFKLRRHELDHFITENRVTIRGGWGL